MVGDCGGFVAGSFMVYIRDRKASHQARGWLGGNLCVPPMPKRGRDYPLITLGFRGWMQQEEA